MGVVHVEARPIAQHDVDEAALELTHRGGLVAEAAGVASRRLFLVRPLDAARHAGVGVDDGLEATTGLNSGWLRIVMPNSVSVPSTAGTPCFAHRYWPVVIASIARLAPPPSMRVRT